MDHKIPNGYTLNKNHIGRVYEETITRILKKKIENKLIWVGMNETIDCGSIVEVMLL